MIIINIIIVMSIIISIIICVIINTWTPRRIDLTRMGFWRDTQEASLWYLGGLRGNDKESNQHKQTTRQLKYITNKKAH